MAKQSKLETIFATYSNRETAILSLRFLWEEKNVKEREEWAKELGFASERSLYVAFKNPSVGVLPPFESNGGEPKPRKTRGILPKEIERWAVLSAQADFIRAGNDPDDFIAPSEVTPEFFLSLRAVREQTPAFVEKALARIGGLESDAGKALRAWAGRPLTAAQEAQEAAAAAAAEAAENEAEMEAALAAARELAARAGRSDIAIAVSALMGRFGIIA